MLNLAMPLPRKVQPRNALPLLNRSLPCHAITLLNTSMPLLRFARPCPCGFIRNRTMPLLCKTSPGLASAGLCRVSPCSTMPLRCYDLHCLCCAYESPTLFCHRRAQRNSAMPLLCLEMPHLALPLLSRTLSRPALPLLVIAALRFAYATPCEQFSAFVKSCEAQRC